jgi:hypothetical protein
MHLSAGAALRLGLGFGANYATGEVVYLSTDSLTTVSLAKPYEGSEGHLEATLEYLSYPNPTSRVNVFWGGGPLVRILGEDGEEAWSIGAVGVFGVEWFAAQTISFHAEYGVSVAYSHSVLEREFFKPFETRYWTVSGTTEGWDARGRPILFGFSVYF